MTNMKGQIFNESVIFFYKYCNPVFKSVPMSLVIIVTLFDGGPGRILPVMILKINSGTLNYVAVLPLDFFVIPCETSCST